MVTFNFSNISGNVGGDRFTTTNRVPTAFGGTTVSTNTFTFGNNPLVLTSNLAGQGLPGDTMIFTVSPLSSHYAMAFHDASDEIRVFESGGRFPDAATYTLTFDAGNGLTRLSNVVLDVARSGTRTQVEFVTTGGMQTTGFTGAITGIRFSSVNAYELNGVTGTPTCFGKGTRIAVPGGARAVEDLAIGEEVLTHDGGTREVLWVGVQCFDVSGGLTEHLRPVIVSAGALGGGLPQRDLVLTVDHALLLDGYLINAGALVNGETIRLATASEVGKRLTVYHIETEDHTVILAEGAPAETYIDATGRREFDNYDRYLDLYGTDRSIPEAPYPRIAAARLLPSHLVAENNIALARTA